MSDPFEASAFDAVFLADDGAEDIAEILNIACESFNSRSATPEQDTSP
jgi:hypothetical protein